MTPKYTIRDFQAEFPNDDVCLEWLKDFLYPAGIECHVCGKVTKHHKVKSRKSYSCDVCGHHVHPTAGTIYHKSSTPLTLWFYAIYLMSATRCGISAKQLERELGVTYKTAWRMFKQIRSMLEEDRGPLKGEVEIDEAYIGGYQKGYRGRPTSDSNKTAVVGSVERGGDIIAKVVPNTTKETLIGHITENVELGTTVFTDEFRGYKSVEKLGYDHWVIKHKIEYVNGFIHTNSIEGFWSLFKGGIRGVYKHVGKSYVQSYLNEYAFRYNRRKSNVPMFQHFLAQTSQLSWWVPYASRTSS